MKKLLVIFLSLTMLLCIGCGKEEPAPTETVPETTVPETTVPETTEATIPVPELVYGTAEVNGVPAVLSTLFRGDTVDVVDSFDEKYAVVKTETGYGLVEKNLIRMNSDPAYETWTGYAAHKSIIYDNCRLAGEALKTLQSNAKVEVLDELGYCYLVRYEEMTGYMATDKVSKTRRSSGGGGGGGSGGGADGGDISLWQQSGIELLSVIVPQDGTVSGQASVLADDTDILLGYFDRGDSIPIVVEEGFAEEREGFYAVYLDGLYAYVPEDLVRMEGEEAYTEWDGFSKHNSKVYDNRWLLGNALDKLKTNTEVHVLYELDNCYFVEIDGLAGFVQKENISEKRFSSGGGGGNGGGGGGDWSPPVL